MLLPLRDQAMSEVLLLPSFRAMLVTLLSWLRSLRRSPLRAALEILLAPPLPLLLPSL